MDSLLFGLVAGFALALILVFTLRRRRGGGRETRVEVRSSVEAIRSVGELIVLKVFTKQIVTSRDHMLGDWGERWLTWLLSSKKTAMVFEFVVDFRYDLRSAQILPRVEGERSVEFIMPPCFYEIQMKDMQIYDEKGAALVPLLLPEWIGQLFGGKFSEKEKNQLIRAAKAEAEGLAKQLTSDMHHEVQQSAETTLRSLARGMGYAAASFQFGSEQPVRRATDLSNLEETVTKALTSVAN